MVEVFEIAFQLLKGETELSHCTTFPVWPLSVKFPGDEPEHTLVVPDTVPPTDVGETVTVAADDAASEQLPF